MRIIWCMDPEIPSASDKIFRHFGPFFVLLPPIKTWKIKILKNFLMLNRCNINENHMMYGSWDTKCIRQKVFAILDHFLHFYPPRILKNQNFEKKWKNHLGILSLYTCYHKWQSHDVWFLRYGAWQIEFFVIWDLLFPFYALNNTKNQNLEKMKKLPGDIILHRCNTNENHMMYGSWDT